MHVIMAAHVCCAAHASPSASPASTPPHPFLPPSHRGTFMQVSQLVAQHYPGVEVIGSSYPIAPLKEVGGQGLWGGRGAEKDSTP